MSCSHKWKFRLTEHLSHNFSPVCPRIQVTLTYNKSLSSIQNRPFFITGLLLRNCIVIRKDFQKTALNICSISFYNMLKIFLKMLKMYNLFSQILKDYSGIILETDGSIRKIQKRAFFHYKKVKKDTLILPSLCS